MTLRLLTPVNGASGYKNNSNALMWVYNVKSGLTITDAQGNTVATTTAPCWLPPGFTINSGTATDEYLILAGDTIEEFRGFLSRGNPRISLGSGGYLQVSGTLKSSALSESETLSNGATGLGAHTETEIVTHTP